MSSAKCNKVVSDIYGKLEFFDEISKYWFIRTFCTIFECYDFNPFSLQSIKGKKQKQNKNKNSVKSVVHKCKNMYQLLNAISS